MRTSMLLLVALVPACTESLQTVEPPPPPGTPPPVCVGTECDPPPPPPSREIELGAPQRLAAGTTHSFVLPLGSPHLLGVVLTSSDPEILTATVTDVYEIELVSHKAGVVTLSATVGESEEVLDTLAVGAIEVERIDVFYRAVPGANEPITQLAGVVGHADDVCVRYVGPAEELLRGRGQFAAGDDAIVIQSGETSTRISESYAHRSTCVRFGFSHLGTADLIASVEGGISMHVPVEVVSAPVSAELKAMVLRNDELVAAPDPVSSSEFVGVDLVAKTADGRFVGGVDVTWTLTGAQVFIDSTKELVFVVSSPGTSQITATAGSIVRTLSVTAE